MTSIESTTLDEFSHESDTEKEEPNESTQDEPHIEENDVETFEVSLPAKSKEKYMTAFTKFDHWRKNKKYEKIDEKIILEFFTQISTTFKPSSLWAIYSMLKPTILAKHRVDISEFKKLNVFLRAKGRGYKGKKSLILTPSQIQEFLNDAPDYHYLATKVALIFGITGACKRNELCNLMIDDVEDNGTMLLVKIPRTDNTSSKSFTVVGKFYNIVKSYMEKRPKNTKINRFFLRYARGSCVQSVIGINKFGSMPKKIAEYLNLPHPEDYTGHSFRRTSMALLADSGADVTTLKMHAGWKSNKIAEEFIHHAILNKRKISEQITETVTSQLNPLVKKVKFDYSRKSLATRVEAGAEKVAKDPLNCPSTSTTIPDDKASDSPGSTGQFLTVEVKDEFTDSFIENLDLDNEDSCISNVSLSNEDERDALEPDSMEVDNINQGINDNYHSDDDRGKIKQDKNVEGTLSASNINVDIIEKIVDKVTARMGEYFREMEKNNERRHQEYSAIRLNELEIQKKMLALREREFEMKKKQIVFCRSVNVARKEES